MKNRIYGEKVTILEENVQKFYDKRAELIEEKGWAAVTLGENTMQGGESTFNFDLKEVLPRLQLNSDARVLELGCGMGRWVKIVLEQCGFYVGVDFSRRMLEAAEEICKEFKGKFRFYQNSIVSALENELKDEDKFDCVIISGVCMYINDDELSRIFKLLPNICSKHCVIYIRVTAAYDQRLTLNQFKSEKLQSDYDAIYRVPAEYDEFFSPLKEAGFLTEHAGFLSARDKRETNSFQYFFRR